MRGKQKREQSKKHCSMMSLGELPNNKPFPNYKHCSGQQQLRCLAPALSRMGLRWAGFVWWNVGWLALSFSESEERSPCSWPLVKKVLDPIGTRRQHGKGETLRVEMEKSRIGAEFGPLVCSRYAIYFCLRQLLIQCLKTCWHNKVFQGVMAVFLKELR